MHLALTGSWTPAFAGELKCPQWVESRRQESDSDYDDSTPNEPNSPQGDFPVLQHIKCLIASAPFCELEAVMKRTHRPRPEPALDENIEAQRTWLTHFAAGRISFR
jgi:hypothetical protein